MTESFAHLARVAELSRGVYGGAAAASVEISRLILAMARETMCQRLNADRTPDQPIPERVVMGSIQYRVFETPYLEPSLSYSALREKRRVEVAAFVNELGADRVISITECGDQSLFQMAVWYRADDSAK